MNYLNQNMTFTVLSNMNKLFHCFPRKGLIIRPVYFLNNCISKIQLHLKTKYIIVDINYPNLYYYKVINIYICFSLYTLLCFISLLKFVNILLVQSYFDVIS